MIDLSSFILPILLNTKRKTSSRASHVLNLGITDQKVHLHKRKSITGKSGLQLISTWSKTTKITNEACSEIGKFMMYLIRNVIPTTKPSDMFLPNHPSEKEYLDLFAKQLNLYEEDEVHQFNIPAISMLINDEVHPHYDSKNPISSDNDATFSITVQVPVTSLTPLLQQMVNNVYTNTIPFCIVMYKRQCLMALGNYERKIEEYICSDSTYSDAREKIVHMLSHSYYTDLDYGGLFFTSHRNRLMKYRFKDYEHQIFKDKMALVNEAVDKCGYWSSILHVFYLYINIHGVKTDDVLSYILFFAHQCNTTLIILKAITKLAIAGKSIDNKCLYTMLVKICEEYNANKNNKDVGCLGGDLMRFCPSNNDAYSPDQVKDVCVFLNKVFAEATYDITIHTKLVPEICYQNYWKLEKKSSR